ncbi:putative mynd domain [Phaeomoniella chlamydospora]|uniref:Putative mynd domain n=1 Tax=Phaeomoniella chlamydospora TaxID=158046 RepID=A0A0G2EW56_PHACM|nr:putative mynd domain [Phaeomoniella chlamydospora]
MNTNDLEAKLKERQRVTDDLLKEPLDPRHYLTRARLYLELGYPDLATGDAHKALELVETGLDDAYSDYPPEVWNEESSSFIPFGIEENEEELSSLRVSCFLLLSECCSLLKCFQDALHFFKRAEELDEHPQFSPRVKQAKQTFLRQYSAANPSEIAGSVLVNNRTDLRNMGGARREIYPWNDHEPDRSSPEVLHFLNERLQDVAPVLEAKTIALPVLHSSDEGDDNADTNNVSIQFGLVAKQDLPPGTRILHEPSLLNACRTLHAPLCDCCQSPLPPLSSKTPPVSCSSCSDVVFCSQACFDLAQCKYHPAICDNEEDLEEIGRDVQSLTPSEDLYLLLLARVVAMAETQDIHPLDLPEIKYIWGDFSTSETPTTLPFTFNHTVNLPHRVLTAMSISPFSTTSLIRYDTWIFQTLYAKFRGVASAKQSTWDGKPEVAAVHPLWCLANHSCDPNIRWEWPAPALSNADSGVADSTSAQPDGVGDTPHDRVGSGIVMAVRTKNERASWTGKEGREEDWHGIKAGEEILNHYCDIRLPVKERREWALGALGGLCMCHRCKWEADQEKA